MSSVIAVPYLLVPALTILLFLNACCCWDVQEVKVILGVSYVSGEKDSLLLSVSVAGCAL
ncbi:hypothetical protein E2C01_044550 [Portunus trituberculatus]|uniref:Uncharacterized protein n=1 Tax=Portunus trituberculatus TaxID=210409 RepID=A0A5B7FSG2_PORTR|nr:hypothetical protein [Portunus trituberculatus]